MKRWKRGEFLFCLMIIWTAALLQGYGLYQEWKEEQEAITAFKLLDMFEMESINYKSNFTIKGSSPGSMTLEEKDELTDRLFHSLKAEEVDAVREEELYTVYGFSPLFRSSLSYGENEINLNLAISYDEVEARTVFYLAIPFIEEDF